jgi:hypothetical protein
VAPIQDWRAWHAAEPAAAMGLTQEALRRRDLFWPLPPEVQRRLMCVLPQERPAWHAAELAAAMGLTQEALRRRVLFWIGQGVLQETATHGGAVSSNVTHVLLS